MGASSPLAADIKCRAVGEPVIESATTDAVGGFQHHHVGDSSLHKPVRRHEPRQPGSDDRDVVLSGSRHRHVGSHRVSSMLRGIECDITATSSTSFLNAR
jgi:hypothetical protein